MGAGGRGAAIPSESAPDARWGQRWGFELVPDGPDATVVTHRYDCSRVPEAHQAQMAGGRVWLAAMAETLRRLDGLVRDNRRRDAPKRCNRQRLAAIESPAGGRWR